MPSFTICAADTNESKKITEFTNGIADLARKYDSEKEFVTSEGNETGQIQLFSGRNSEEVTDSTETEYTLQDFQTARLIVRANDKFDEFDAKEVLISEKIVSSNKQEYDELVRRYTELAEQ